MLIYFILAIGLISNQQWFQKTWQNYTISSASKDSVTVNRLVEIIRVFDNELQQFFANKLEGTVSIILARSNSEYEQFTGNSLPDWSGAVAFKKRKIIMMKPETPFVDRQYSESLKHELVHLYCSERTIPLWLEEGLAMYLSEKTITWWDHIRVGNAVVSDNIVSLYEIDDLLSFGYSKASLAYLQSLIAVEFIVDQYGKKGLQFLIIASDSEKPVDYLFRHVLVTEYSDFELAYTKFLKKKYRYMFMLQFEYLLLILIVVLVFLAYLRMRIRNKKIVSGWEE